MANQQQKQKEKHEKLAFLIPPQRDDIEALLIELLEDYDESVIDLEKMIFVDNSLLYLVEFKNKKVYDEFNQKYNDIQEQFSDEDTESMSFNKEDLLELCNELYEMLDSLVVYFEEDTSDSIQISGQVAEALIALIRFIDYFDYDIMAFESPISDMNSMN